MAETPVESFQNSISATFEKLENYFTEHARKISSIFMLGLIVFFYAALYPSLPLTLFKYMFLDCCLLFATVAFLFYCSLAIEGIYSYCEFEKKKLENKNDFEERYLDIWEEAKYYKFVPTTKLITSSASYETPPLDKMEFHVSRII